MLVRLCFLVRICVVSVLAIDYCQKDDKHILCNKAELNCEWSITILDKNLTIESKILPALNQIRAEIANGRNGEKTQKLKAANIYQMVNDFTEKLAYSAV